MARYDEAHYAAVLERLGVDNVNARRIAHSRHIMSRGVMIEALLARDVDAGVEDTDHAVLDFLTDYDHTDELTVHTSLLPGRAHS